MASVLAIDPGLEGGICILGYEREVKLLQVMPLIGNEINCHALAILIKDAALEFGVTFSFIEKAQCRPGQSAQSGLKTGRNYGILEGVLSSLNMPYKEVRPQEWTKTLTAAHKPEGATTAVLYKLGKQRNVREATKMFPHANLLATSRSKVPHLGLVDALLIANYGLTLL